MLADRPHTTLWANSQFKLNFSQCQDRFLRKFMSILKRLPISRTQPIQVILQRDGEPYPTLRGARNCVEEQIVQRKICRRDQTIPDKSTILPGTFFNMFRQLDIFFTSSCWESQSRRRRSNCSLGGKITTNPRVYCCCLPDMEPISLNRSTSYSCGPRLRVNG